MASKSVSVDKLNQKPPPPPPQPPPPPPIPPPPKQWECKECGVRNTPVKRSGPQGPGTLCNACGLRVRKKSRAVAAAGAAAAAAAAATGIPSQRRSRAKKKPPPKKPGQRRKREGEPPPPKKRRLEKEKLAIKQSPTPQPAVTVPLAASPPVSTVPSPRSAMVAPVSPNVATGILVPIASATHSDFAASAPLAASTASAPIQCHAAPALVTAPSPVQMVSHPSPAAAPPPNDDGASAAQAEIWAVMPAQAVAPPPPSTQALSVPARGISLDRFIGATATKTAIPTEDLSPEVSPRVPPATPEGGTLISTDEPTDAVVALFAQSGETGDSKADGILTAFGTGAGTIDAGSAESTNEIEQDNFPGSVFARSDSDGTNSTQADVLEMLGGAMKSACDDLPPGTSMVSVADTYKERGEVGGSPTLQGPAAMPVTPPATLLARAVQPGDVAQCVQVITVLDRVNSQMCEHTCGIEERMAACVQKQEELAVAENELRMLMSQLVEERAATINKQVQVCEQLNRAKCFLNYLQKQAEGQYVASQ